MNSFRKVLIIFIVLSMILFVKISAERQEVEIGNACNNDHYYLCKKDWGVEVIGSRVVSYYQWACDWSESTYPEPKLCSSLYWEGGNMY